MRMFLLGLSVFCYFRQYISSSKQTMRNLNIPEQIWAVHKTKPKSVSFEIIQINYTAPFRADCLTPLISDFSSIQCPPPTRPERGWCTPALWSSTVTMGLLRPVKCEQNDRCHFQAEAFRGLLCLFPSGGTTKSPLTRECFFRVLEERWPWIRTPNQPKIWTHSIDGEISLCCFKPVRFKAHLLPQYNPL